MEQATQTQIDSGIFYAIVHTESSWIPEVVRHEHDGTCSVGLGQINVDCQSGRVPELQDAQTNLQAMSKILKGLKNTCHKNCQNLGWLIPYNPGDTTYVSRIRRKVEALHARHR